MEKGKIPFIHTYDGSYEIGVVKMSKQYKIITKSKPTPQSKYIKWLFAPEGLA